MTYTKIPTATFDQIQMNAGIFVDSFDPETGKIGNIIGATTGGANFNDTISFIDFGEDIDNCPKNTMELKRLDSHNVKVTGTYVTISANLAKQLAAAADVTPGKVNKIVPRNDLKLSDFVDIWWIGDYGAEDGGLLAIHIFNSLSTGGMQVQTGDKAKGKFSFEFTGHYSIKDQDKVPYEMYISSPAEDTDEEGGE